ncbi:MAG: hypothetical protein ACRD3E_00610 [Terriglobales bacterium]
MRPRRLLSIAVLCGAVLSASMANASTNSNNTTVGLTATVNESLTVGLSGATQTWTTGTANPLTPGQASNNGDSAITVTTTWTLSPSRTAVVLYAYFASATAALVPTAGTTNIPASDFEIKVGAGSFTPVSGTNAGFGVAGSSLQLQSTTINGTNKVGSATAVLTFNINLSTLPQLPADTYTGTLNIQAQATP